MGRRTDINIPPCPPISKLGWSADRRREEGMRREGTRFGSTDTMTTRGQNKTNIVCGTATCPPSETCGPRFCDSRFWNVEGVARLTSVRLARGLVESRKSTRRRIPS